MHSESDLIRAGPVNSRGYGTLGPNGLCARAVGHVRRGILAVLFFSSMVSALAACWSMFRVLSYSWSPNVRSECLYRCDTTSRALIVRGTIYLHCFFLSEPITTFSSEIAVPGLVVIPHACPLFMQITGEGGAAAEYCNRSLEYIDARVNLFLLSLILASYPSWYIVTGPLRRALRMRRGLCLGCGYNLFGNDSGRCPECGASARIPGTEFRGHHT